jgi:hypothetical protein
MDGQLHALAGLTPITVEWEVFRVVLGVVVRRMINHDHPVNMIL